MGEPVRLTSNRGRVAARTHRLACGLSTSKIRWRSSGLHLIWLMPSRIDLGGRLRRQRAAAHDHVALIGAGEGEVASGRRGQASGAPVGPPSSVAKSSSAMVDVQLREEEPAIDGAAVADTVEVLIDLRRVGELGAVVLAVGDAIKVGVEQAGASRFGSFQAPSASRQGADVAVIISR